MMKKVVGAFERVSDASGAVRAIRTAGFLASDVELVVRRVDVGVAVEELTSAASGATRRIATGGLAGGVLGGLAGLALMLMGVEIPGFEAGLAAGLKPTTLAGAGLGAVAGSAMGAMTGFWARRAQTEHELESLRRGGALVAIHADESRVDEVERILYQQGAYAIEDRVVRRRNAAWPAGNPLATSFADEGHDRVGAHERIRPTRVSAGARR